ncbi:MAG: hypothetical protein ABI618_20460 [Nitrospirota bacterium]
MVQREDRPSTTLGARATTVESAIIPAGSVSHQPGAPEGARGKSAKPQSNFIQIADAVLKGELESRASQGTEVLPGNVLPDSQDLETTVKLLRQQPGTLADAIMEVPKYRPEHMAHIASQFPRIEDLHKADDFQPISFLKIPLPVSPGQIGHINFTLINEDPKEIAVHRLYATDFVDISGHRIPESHITVSPNPVRIPPGESVDGRIEIRVPTGTPQGSYGGVLQTEDITRLQAVIQLSVSA